MDTTIKIEAPKHWAASLKENYNVIATIRHKTNGNKNLYNVLCKVVQNNEECEKVVLEYKRVTYSVQYNELTDINKLVNIRL